MKRALQGFTLVELMIVLVIMTILLGLGVAMISNLQAQGRDNERKQDVENIARGLENRYNNGTTYIREPDKIKVENPAGSYPGDSEIWQVAYYHNAVATLGAFPGVPTNSLMSPDGTTLDAVCKLYGFIESARCRYPHFAEEPGNIQIVFDNGSGGWKDLYVYEFIGPDGRYCNDNCSRFNIYWISETDKTVVMGIPGLKIYKSKHQ